jgi:hypothetical protein
MSMPLEPVRPMRASTGEVIVVGSGAVGDALARRR